MSPLDSFVARSQQCAGLFRLGRDVEAALIMVDLFDELQPSIDRMSGQVQQQWGHLLTHMLDSQEAQNWLGLADYLEFELVELLEAGLVH